MRPQMVKRIQNRDDSIEDYNLKFRIHQIVDTLLFELDKGQKRFFIMVIVSSVIILLNPSIYILGDNTDPISPESFMSFSSTLILITSIVFGGSLIVRDFEHAIGNILFPKISKKRLLIGRLITAILLTILVISYFYISSAGITYVLNKEIPKELFYSFIYSLAYSVLLLAFIIFLSSTLKSTSVVTIVSLLVIILIFPVLEVLIAVLDPGFEPVFLLTFYARPILGVFYGTSGRNLFDIVNTETGESLINMAKFPSPFMVGLGVSVLSAFFIILSYVRFERRQNH
ncbi:MAG: hypothetical protein ACXACR_14565 [Candidatus Hodarchaeales archaeon]|jgi:ABC-type transport system involved in multi-copper enzyme maturation permease subunit